MPKEIVVSEDACILKKNVACVVKDQILLLQSYFGNCETYIQFLRKVQCGYLALGPRSRPGTPGCTGSPQRGCDHMEVPVPGPSSQEDNSHSTSMDEEKKHANRKHKCYEKSKT